ncbi:MAG: VOC family protein [Acidobacteria bacterium]|nr:VOC family protein [Acidobacteriota bacterium]
MSLIFTSGAEVALVVRDEERMLAFYRDFLGLAVTDELEVGAIKVYWLDAGGTLIKMVCPAPPPEAAAKVDELLGCAGLRYLTMRIQNVEETIASAEAAGATIIRQTANESTTMALLADPDGNIIEITRRVA